MLKALRDDGIITEQERRQLSQGNGGKTNQDFLEWLMGYDQKFSSLYPAPATADPEPRRADAVWQEWPPETGVSRVADDVPDRKDRIRCLGNAVVPQQFYPFFMLVMLELRKEGQT